MITVTLKEVSAKLSERLVKWSPIYARVTKVINKNTFELTQSKEAATPLTFFKDDSRNWMLSPVEKERVFWQYHRSFHCEMYVHAFALALKMLCDSGITFVHEGYPVLDFRVMYLKDFDVSDIRDSQKLNLIDPRSGVSVSSICTYENLKLLRAIDTNACQLLCLAVPHPERAGAVDPKYYQFCEKSFAPHWWIAAVVDSKRLGSMQRCLFHIDICAAAYDDRAFPEHHGSIVSLRTFTTPDYELIPTINLPEEMRMSENDEKFIMTPYTRATHLQGRPSFPLLQPYWLRYMRSYYFSDASAIVVSTLERYLNQSRSSISDGIDGWERIVYKLRDKFMLRIRPLTEITIRDYRDASQFNGQRGTIQCFSHNLSEDNLIPVRVHANNSILKLSPRLIQLDVRRQYLSYEELHRVVVEQSPYARMVVPSRADNFEEGLFRSALRNDENMRRVYAVLNLGKITYRFLLDRKFTNGMTNFLFTAFDDILQPWQAQLIRTCLKIVDHPKGYEALNILKHLDLDRETGKPIYGRMLVNGMVEQRECEDFYRGCNHVLGKIDVDYELREAFTMINRIGLFCDIREHLNVLRLYEYGLDLDDKEGKKWEGA